jgi:hypothetical protein
MISKIEKDPQAFSAFCEGSTLPVNLASSPDKTTKGVDKVSTPYPNLPLSLRLTLSSSLQVVQFETMLELAKSQSTAAPPRRSSPRQLVAGMAPEPGNTSRQPISEARCYC